MSQRLSKALAGRRGEWGRPPSAWSLAALFALGLAAAVPSVFLWRSLGLAGTGPGARGLPGGPGGGLASAETAAQVELHLQRAYELQAAERHAEAFEELATASRLDPSDPRPFMGLAEVCRSLDYDELATEHYRKAIRLDPENTSAKISLAMILSEFGKSREAIDLLREVEKKKPGDAFVWAELAINAMHLGNPREAISLLERYNSKQGRQAWGYENLGRAYAEAGELEKAEKAYREALAINSRSALAHLWLGQLLITGGGKAEAEEHLKTFRELRDLQTQQRYLEQAVNRNPGDVMALVRLAHVRTLLGMDREALVPLERAVRLAPGDDRVKALYEKVKRKVEGPESAEGEGKK